MKLHYAVNGLGNAGDTVLVAATRKILGGQFQGERLDLPAKAEYINQFDVIVIGGGGLFIRDTKPGVSGWRWNISIDELKKIKVPIIVFAIGYNRFRDQADFDPVFSEHVKVLIEKASFFSMRDKCAPEQMRPYVSDLVNKIIYQPCPASLLSHFYPIDIKPEKTLVFSPAMDRPELRKMNKDAIIKALNYAKDKGWKVQVVGHIQMDSDFKSNFEFIDLHKKPAEYIMDFYSKVGLTIGMRLHSAIIPFGLGLPIAPIISHDKIKYFLDDVRHPEWAVEMESPDLTDHLINRIDDPTVDRWAALDLLELTARNIHGL